jgi:hypothetical protein
MNFRPCVNCKQKSFVNDTSSGDWICTKCGAVVARWMYGELERTFVESTPVPKVPQRGANTALALRQIRTMTDKFFPNERASARQLRILEDAAYTLGYNQRTVNRAQAQLHKFPCLLEIKPVEKTMAAVLIVSKRSLGFFVNVKSASNDMGYNDLGQFVIRVCNTIGLSQRSDPVSSIPYLTELLGFKYKYSVCIRRAFEKYSKENGSVGPLTLLALILFRFWNANRSKSKFKTNSVDLQYIADITHTSLTSLSGYVDGQHADCTLFPKKSPT